MGFGVLWRQSEVVGSSSYLFLHTCTPTLIQVAVKLTSGTEPVLGGKPSRGLNPSVLSSILPTSKGPEAGRPTRPLTSFKFSTMWGSMDFSMVISGIGDSLSNHERPLPLDLETAEELLDTSKGRAC